jgi:ribosomal protein L23
MSEKAYKLSEEQNTYVFAVGGGGDKLSVARAVTGQYKVKVAGVRIAKSAAKNRRTIRRRGRNIYHGRTSGTHKAYVTLAEGEKLPIFASLKEQEQKEAQAEQKEKK